MFEEVLEHLLNYSLVSIRKDKRTLVQGFAVALMAGMLNEEFDKMNLGEKI